MRPVGATISISSSDVIDVTGQLDVGNLLTVSRALRSALSFGKK
jgi:hypothetical protein